MNTFKMIWRKSVSAALHSHTLPNTQLFCLLLLPQCSYEMHYQEFYQGGGDDR